MHQIIDQKILMTLSRLHKEASSDKYKLLTSLPKFLLGKFVPKDASKAHLAISREQGEFIYDLLIRTKAKNIVEFGTSFGISTIYLAAAAQKTDGQVVTSELLPEKCVRARSNFEAAGVASVIDLREGDVLETLTTVNDNIDFLLLDGWNNLYLELLKLIEHKLKPGATIYTDNASFPSTREFIEYLHQSPSKFENTRIKTNKGDVELSRYKGAKLRASQR